MAVAYQPISQFNYGSGIDQQSSEDQIADGFIEDARNVDPNPKGYLAKRKGYQGFAGSLPVRVTSVEEGTSPYTLCFILDSSIDLGTVRSTPIIVQGRSSAGSSGQDFVAVSDTVQYYDEFSADVRKSIPAGTSTTSISNSEHRMNSEDYVVETLESTSPINLSNSVFESDSISISTSTFEADIQTVNSTGAPLSALFMFRKKTPAAGKVYKTSTTFTGSTINIPAGTHALDNFNIMASVYKDNGSSLERVIPDSVVVSVAGLVSIGFTTLPNPTSLVIYLTSVPSSNIVTGSIAASTNSNVSITGLSSPLVFVYCFLENIITGSRELVSPNSITVDAATGTATVGIVNGTSSAANFIVYYEYGQILTDKLCVQPNVGTLADTAPQLTLWGLEHSEIYSNSAANEAGWVNHLDVIHQVATEYPVSGLGGNLFRVASQGSAEDVASYLLPTVYPDIRQRLDSTKVIGPAFVGTSDSSARTRGFIQFDGGDEGNARVSSVSFDGGVAGGTVKYTLSTPNLNLSSYIPSITISPTAGTEDYLSVQGSGKSRFNGEFRIAQISTGTNTLTIWVFNDSVDSSDYDETDSGALASVFTDQLSLGSGNHPFIPSDYLFADLFNTQSFQVVSAKVSILVVRNVFDELECPAGLRLTGQRTASVVPIRDINENSTVSDLVRGDMLQFSGLVRLPRILSINPFDSLNVTVDGTGTVATVSGLPDTSPYAVGKKLLLLQAGEYTGEVTVEEILSTTSFSFTSTGTSTGVSGVVAGNTIELDEAITIRDTLDNSNSISVPARWVPIEAPIATGSLPVKTYRSHFPGNSYDSQPFLRSSMVSDNMYFTNHDDLVTKYDGFSLYRSGLPRWQAQLFTVVDTGATAKIGVPQPKSAPVASWTDNYFQLTNEANLSTFAVGDVVSLASAPAKTYVVQSVSDISPTAYVYVNQNIQGSSGADTLQAANAFWRYYFRLNTVDANDNITLSATTGSEEFFVELTQDAAVRLRLAGFPVLENYNYDRLEVEIYRTKVNTQAPFYKIATIPLNFDNYTGYVDYVDSASDEVLVDLDAALTSIRGDQLGGNLSQPLLAQYVTTAANRLVLANVQGFPQLDIKFSTSASDSASLATRLAGKRLLFRKDNTDAATTSDNSSRIAVEFKSSSLAVSGISFDGIDVFSFTTAAHTLTAPGQWVYLFSNGSPRYTEVTGWFQVQTVSDSTHFTIKLPSNDGAGSIPVPDNVNRVCIATAPADLPVYIGTDDQNYQYTSGNDGLLINAMLRAANALNAAQRMTDPTLVPGFVPWLTARGGGDADFNQLLVSQPKVLTTSMEVLLPTVGPLEDLQLFVNSIKRDSEAQAGAFSNVFPSRILVSYPDYPEVFDNPLATLDSQSESAVDVNPADGQQITGVIPFFGDSAFGAALQSGVVVVFKTRSIYIIDLAAKAAGQNPVQKIESQGLGCTAPFSLAPTRDAIMFANESGIFRLNKSLQVEFVGQSLDRAYRSDVNKDQLSLAHGHHYALGRLYKLSFPVGTNTKNSDVFVYNHTREYNAVSYNSYTPGGFGSWTRYDSHPVTGWANFQGVDSLFGTTFGRVMSVRRAGDDTDYRDDAAAISAFALLRADCLGLDSVRKKLANIILYFRSPVGNSTLNSHAELAIDLTKDFDSLDSFTLLAQNSPPDGLSDTTGSKIKGLRFSSDKRYFTWAQIRVSNNGKDEGMELVRSVFVVASSDVRKGIREAADTPTK